MGRAAAEDPPGAGFARLAEALPTESEGLVDCIFTMQKGARITYLLSVCRSSEDSAGSY
ncbi:hypothetical protein ACE4RR_17780 [Alteribacillus sp. HJP-4]